MHKRGLVCHAADWDVFSSRLSLAGELRVADADCKPTVALCLDGATKTEQGSVFIPNSTTEVALQEQFRYNFVCLTVGLSCAEIEEFFPKG